jgi:hypothetical protein
MDPCVEARIEVDTSRVGFVEVKLTTEALKGVGDAFTFGWGSIRVSNREVCGTSLVAKSTIICCACSGKG